MKENNKMSLINLIDYLSEKVTNFLKKAGRLAANKNKKDSVLIATKIVVTIIVLAVLSIPFSLVKEIGVMLVYKVGASLRAFLSFAWAFMLDLSYLIFCLTVISKVLSSILEDKELNLIEENRRKDTRLKKNIFLPIIKVVRICSIIAAVPLVLIIFAIMIMIGMNIALVTHGYYLFSTFLILIGFSIILGTAVLLILDVMTLKKGSKKYVNIALGGLIVFIIGIICINFELARYKYVDSLPSDFTTTTEQVSLRTDKSKTYKALKAKYNENVAITKEIDNSLGDEILIETTTSNTSISLQTIATKNNKINLIYSNKLVLGIKDIEKIYNMLINSITNETLYNYNLLKYSKVTIYGNEEILSKIEVGDYEK